MPKIGMEPIRRAALVKATIAEVGDTGSLDVPVSRIARRAGMSTALAHHYFGGKEQIFTAAMRQILRDYRVEVVTRLAEGGDRTAAIVRANFAQSCFAPEVVAAWMTFYAAAQASPEARRLLRVYQRRLRSNLVHSLRGQVADPAAAAEILAATIDGLYIRQAHADTPPDGTALVLSLLTTLRSAA